LGTQVALKRVEGPDEKFLQEVNLLSTLNHPHIVRFLGLVRTDTIYLVMEYMDSGSLDRLIVEKKDQLTEADLVSMFHFFFGFESFSLSLFLVLISHFEMDRALSASSGMRYLEKKKVVHRDLALRNIL
jgi:serine/threonine protein kinase